MNPTEKSGQRHRLADGGEPLPRPVHDHNTTKIVEPLADPPKVAFRNIGAGNTKGYELLAAGELEAFKIGRATRITRRSQHAYVERQLAASPFAKA